MKESLLDITQAFIEKEQLFLTSGASTHLLMNLNGEHGGMGATAPVAAKTMREDTRMRSANMVTGQQQKQK